MALGEVKARIADILEIAVELHTRAKLIALWKGDLDLGLESLLGDILDGKLN